MKRKYVWMLLLAGSVFPAYAQEPIPQVRFDEDVATGTVKEYEKDKRLVVDVRWRPDREYNLADTADVRVKIPPNISIGDRVRIVEREQDGRQVVTVERAAARAADATRKREGERAGADATAQEDVDTTFGTVKEYEKGKRLVVDLRWRPDYEYNLAETTDVAVTVAPNISVGDRVRVVEREQDGRNVASITRAKQTPDKESDRQ